MIKLTDYQTENALPEEMRTAERISLSYAFDKQKQKFLESLKRVYIWADLKRVEDDKLDFLAVENRVLFYDSELEPEVKRGLIQNSVYWYMKMGTCQAMEEMVGILFGTGTAYMEEWFEYGGKPYHFRVLFGIPDTVKEVDIYKIISMIKCYKRLTARLDSIVYDLKTHPEIKVLSFTRLNNQIKVMAHRPE